MGIREETEYAMLLVEAKAGRDEEGGSWWDGNMREACACACAADADADVDAGGPGPYPYPSIKCDRYSVFDGA